MEVTVIIYGLFRTPEEDTHHHHDPEEILKMARVFQKPAMFRNFDWEIVETNTGEILASWDSDTKEEFIAPAITGF